MEFLTINEFINAINNKYGYEHIRQLIKRGEIEHEIIDGHYAIYPNQVEDIKKRNVPKGRPIKLPL